jgi:hypothetical protein
MLAAVTATRGSEARGRGGRVGPTAAYVERGTRRVFASAIDWPGWSRSGKTEELALEALAAAAPRYAIVAVEADVRFPSSAADRFVVIERVAGSASTDFGVPEKPCERDHEPLTPRVARRNAAIVSASWRVFGRVVAGAPASLRKGPRGGGRDRDAIVAHVVGAEVAYSRKLGLRPRASAPDDDAAVAAMRVDIEQVLSRATAGEPIVPKGWLPGYAARRIAWHVLDHAWEIEDRSGS